MTEADSDKDCILETKCSQNFSYPIPKVEMNVVVVGTREERSKEGEPQIRAWPRNTIQSLKNKQNLTYGNYQH